MDGNTYLIKASRLLRKKFVMRQRRGAGGSGGGGAKAASTAAESIDSKDRSAAGDAGIAQAGSTSATYVIWHDIYVGIIVSDE